VRLIGRGLEEDLGKRAEEGGDVMVKPPGRDNEGTKTSSHWPGRNCTWSEHGSWGFEPHMYMKEMDQN